jgi:hypothetical protein
MEVNALCARLHVDREVRLRILIEDGSPLAFDLWGARLLLPPAALTWSDERRHVVLLHELAHIMRRDSRAQLTTHLACALNWFNPLIWMAATRLRRERELACDDQVLRSGARASSYATHLLDIARSLQPVAEPCAALAMARPSDLEGRLVAVLAVDRPRQPRRATRWLMSVTLTFISTAAITFTASPQHTRRDVHSASTPYVVTTEVMAAADLDPVTRADAETTLRTALDSQDRERATLALAFSSGQDVVPALLGALADPDAPVREKAAVGLALRRDPRVVAPLIVALADRNSGVREKAAIALATSGDPPGVREKAAAGLMLAALIP